MYIYLFINLVSIQESNPHHSKVQNISISTLVLRDLCKKVDPVTGGSSARSEKVKSIALVIWAIMQGISKVFEEKNLLIFLCTSDSLAVTSSVRSKPDQHFEVR
jgi:hypothetical protein